MSRIFDLARSPWTVFPGFQKSRNLLIVPIAPVEEHGPHLPLGTDLLFTEHWARELAERLSLRFPDLAIAIYPSVPIAYGCIPLSSGLRGCFHVSSSTLRAVVRELLIDAAQSGIESTVVLSAHADPRHQLALEYACEDANASSSMVALSPSGALFSAGELGLAISIGAETRPLLEKAPDDFHAGWIETSMMLELDPTLVDDGYENLASVHISARDMADPGIVAERTKGQGWLGSPALASRAAGRELLSNAADFLERAASALIERSGWERYAHHFLYGKQFFPQD